jgi:hypothetical protein
MKEAILAQLDGPTETIRRFLPVFRESWARMTVSTNCRQAFETD